MKIAIILNTARLTPELKTKLDGTELIEKYNINYDLFLTDPKNMADTLKNLNHQSYNACIVGGGDGTIRTAAQVLIEHDIPLAILPLGTFNLLAKTLEHPNDIDTLFAMIKNNKTKQIDLAEVNGHVIINHAWIGFYYSILKARKKYTSALEKKKLLKIIFNISYLFRNLPLLELTIKTDQDKLRCNTYLVYVGNNEFYTNLFDFGERKSLTSGLLSVVVLNCQNRWQLFRCIINSLFGNFKSSKYVTHFTTDELSIIAKHSPANVVIDGELFHIPSPLNFVIYQKKLTVVIP